MDCPHCKTPLAMSDRQGIEIDYCPTCRGVWLDRGELDKIVERTLNVAPPSSQGRERMVPPVPVAELREGEGPRYERPYRDDDDDYHRQHGRHKKRRSFLSDLFDFD